MTHINTEHLTVNTRIQGAKVNASTWITEDNRVINLIEVNVRNTECSATIDIWPKSTQEVQNIIDTLTQHIKNVQAKEVESIANAALLEVAA